jgi:hypothetical protein
MLYLTHHIKDLGHEAMKIFYFEQAWIRTRQIGHQPLVMTRNVVQEKLCIHRHPGLTTMSLAAPGVPGHMAPPRVEWYTVWLFLLSNWKPKKSGLLPDHLLLRLLYQALDTKSRPKTTPSEKEIEPRHESLAIHMNDTKVLAATQTSSPACFLYKEQLCGRYIYTSG